LIRVVKSANLEAGAASLAEEPRAEWFMDYYNADGSVAEMCGNGVRVFARYLTEKGLVQLDDGQTLAVGTRDGVKDLTRNRAGFAVDLGRWRLTETDVLVSAKNLHTARPSQGIYVGNPHLVCLCDSVEDLDPLIDGPALSTAPEGGTNVEWISVRADGGLDFVVYERGVGPTKACGTGSCAGCCKNSYSCCTCNSCTNDCSSNSSSDSSSLIASLVVVGILIAVTVAE
jgi:diaminopimelate epimerase